MERAAADAGVPVLTVLATSRSVHQEEEEGMHQAYTWH